MAAQVEKEELAKTGDARKFHIIGEVTLESRNEAGNGIVADLTKLPHPPFPYLPRLTGEAGGGEESGHGSNTVDDNSDVLLLQLSGIEFDSRYAHIRALQLIGAHFTAQ